MKIAISSQGPELRSQLDERFGRCPYFLLINPESLEFEVLENSEAEQGAGVSAAKLVIDAGAEVVITNNIGPKAFRVLKEAGVDIIVNGAGRVIDVIQQYKNGVFNSAAKPNSQGHPDKKREDCLNVL
ncbi:MAG: NifB/NifX family molybdenum-iron cluster-binding protein [Desulforegulaceae bacterium]|nr:NifB/NifX family molybdenum-iron cluster-binding protein [Desulforegulaceae bacterium]